MIYTDSNKFEVTFEGKTYSIRIITRTYHIWYNGGYIGKIYPVINPQPGPPVIWKAGGDFNPQLAQDIGIMIELKDAF